MSRLRERAAQSREFIRFLKTTLSLFREADDPDEFAEHLERGEINEALEQTDLSEEELAERVDEIGELGESALDQEEVEAAVEEYRWGGNNHGHSD